MNAFEMKIIPLGTKKKKKKLVEFANREEPIWRLIRICAICPLVFELKMIYFGQNVI